MLFSTPVPAEIVLLILSYLPVSSISYLPRLSKEWLDFIDQNSCGIYHSAALLEGWDYLRDSYSPRAMSGVNCWKDLCKNRKFISHSWTGHAPSSILSSQRTLEPSAENKPQNNVHRIKVDEKIGIIINTSQVGGLVVSDLESGQLVWELPVWYVHPHAHLEYGNGFMIFDRFDGNKEVWRRTADIPVDVNTANIDEQGSLIVDSSSSPDAMQQGVVNYMMQNYIFVELSKGHFTPHAVLHMPEPTRAFRFVYPTLLVCSLVRAWLWDVRTGTVESVVEGIQNGPEMDYNVICHFDEEMPAEEGNVEQEQGEDEDAEGMLFDEDEVEPELPNLPAASGYIVGTIRYVDLSSRHLFFVGRFIVRVFDRRTKKCVMDVPSTAPLSNTDDGRAKYGRWSWRVVSDNWASDHLQAENKEQGKGKMKVDGSENDDRAEAGKGRKFKIDSYRQARREGREVVRMPLRFRCEEHRSGDGDADELMDHFVSAHVSEDGRHFVALLGGSRLIIMPNFENLLVKRGSECKQRKAKEVFNNTLDVQLGSPLTSSGIYLAYENGKIGVVTTNSVYIVTPDFRELDASEQRPELAVSRVPFFSHPSWLDSVSCLMLSDTGLYINWNPTTEVEKEIHSINFFKDANDHGDTIQAVAVNRPSGTTIYREGEDEEVDPGVEAVERWEQEYQRDLRILEIDPMGGHRVGHRGGVYVAAETRHLETSEISIVHTVRFAPPINEGIIF